jgi:hypothetical protein
VSLTNQGLDASPGVCAKLAWRSIVVGLVAVISCFMAVPLRAQDNGASDWDTSDTRMQCVPECRSGYHCVQGECSPICQPECGPGYLCTAGGACVREKPAAQPEVTHHEPVQSSDPNQCLPACRASYMCVQGQCVSACNPLCAEGEYCTAEGECVAGSPPAEEEAEAGPPRDPSADSVVNLHFDALGLLQFGLTPTVEFGKRFSGYARLRLPNTGLLSYVLLPEDDMKFHWGLGGAIGIHFFSSREGNMRGVFGGPALEYTFMRMRDESRRKAAYGTHSLIPQLDLGYRWAFGNFLLGAGGRIGLAIPVAAYDRRLGKNGCRGANACGDEDRDLLFMAGVFLDLGWFL